MEENNSRVQAERERLAKYLGRVGIKYPDVQARLGAQFDNLVSELATMGEFIDAACEKGLEGDLESAGEIMGAGAGIQKDRVYNCLTKGLGLVKGREGSLLEIDGIALMRLIETDPQVIALRNYIHGRYEEGVGQLEVNLKKHELRASIV